MSGELNFCALQQAVKETMPAPGIFSLAGEDNPGVLAKIYNGFIYIDSSTTEVFLLAKKEQYIALYRRWRPQTFKEIAGQEHVTRTLQNALRLGRVAHAYLFCGLRGTGKTTMAKLLSKSLNCQEAVAGDQVFPVEPCNHCVSCQDINRGRSMDVLEIDAASNRGIDEIRELRDKVRYAPAQGRYKVYIIDEVHMLTNEAFNALLKTLEEPPGKVVFILATTEASRLPATVVSRCQRFDFRLLEPKEISERLQEVAGNMSFKIDENGLGLLANLAEGSLRDALGFLEQCSSYAGEAVEVEQIQSFFGLAAPASLHALMEAVYEQDLPGGFAVIKEVVFSGKEPGQFLKDLSGYLRFLLLQEGGEEDEAIKQDTPFLAPFLRKQKGRFLQESLLEMLDITCDLERQLRSVTRPQFLLELGFLRLVRAHRLGSYLSSGDLVKKLEELEQLQGLGQEQPPTSFPHTNTPAPGNRPQEINLAADNNQTADHNIEGKVNGNRLKSAWEDKILPELKRKHITVYAWLEGGSPYSLEGEVLTIAFLPSHQFHRDQTERPEHKKIIEKVAGYHLQQNIRVKTSFSSSSPAGNSGEEEVQDDDWDTAAGSSRSAPKKPPGEKVEIPRPESLTPPGDENPFIREVQRIFNGRSLPGKWSDITGKDKEEGK